MPIEIQEKNVGIYIHIPFCVKKCNYCDFYSIPAANEKLKKIYVDALLAHIDEHTLQLAPYTVDTIYFGGGTPSVLSEQQIGAIIKRIKKNFSVDKKCEITLEVNPGTVTKEKLAAIKRCGVNRLSIGCQSFVDEHLKTCGRIHTARENIQTVDNAVKAGFKNINVDIMFGLPNQELGEVVSSIERAVNLGATHISLYGLTIEEGTRFHELYRQKKLALPNEDAEREMYFISCAVLSSLGFKHYEISNFAKPGYESAHNLKYWNCDEYIGFGPAAHSFFSEKRFFYKDDTALYIRNFTENYQGPGIVEKCIDVRFGTQMAEYVMLRMRLGDGIICDEFKRRFGRTFESMYLDKMTPYIKSGHIVKTAKGYAFSEKGMYVSNYILSRIIDFDIVIPGV